LTRQSPSAGVRPGTDDAAPLPQAQPLCPSAAAKTRKVACLSICAEIRGTGTGLIRITEQEIGKRETSVEQSGSSKTLKRKVARVTLVDPRA